MRARRLLTRSREAGLTLLEILVALSIGAFMLVGIITLVVSVSQSRVELSRTSEMVENGRYALQLLREDIAKAGFYGRYSLRGAAVTFSEPDPCATPADVIGTLFSPGDDRVPFPVFGFAPNQAPTCLNQHRVDTPVLMVQRVATRSVTVAEAQGQSNNHPFLQVSSCGDDDQPFAVARSSDASSQLTLETRECDQLAEAWAFVTHAYYLSACNDCANDDGIPTLNVREMIGGTVQRTALVEGVEAINFQYGLDADANGSPDCYVTDPEQNLPSGSACDSLNTSEDRWRNVVAVRVNLLVRSIEPSAGWHDTRTYDLGLDSRLGPFEDGFRRRVLSTVVMIPNVAGVRE